jgi:GrpB-like predicted nucleotidyltransferase (UPF0157 family)
MGDRIVLTPYDPAWPSLFAELGAAMRTALGPVAIRIDHIGSTAIPGLAAKPIIDVQVSVAALDPVEAYRDPLERLGYVFRAANPDLSKRYFREKPGERRTHIHVRRAGSWSEQFALLFRDYLRTHDEDARLYEQTKRRLAEEYGEDGHGYTDAKGPIIWEIMQRASQWLQDTGYVPGPSDA